MEPAELVVVVTVIIVDDGVEDVAIDDVAIDDVAIDDVAIDDVEFVALLVATGMIVAREAGRVDCPDVNTAHACSTTNQISFMTLPRG